MQKISTHIQAVVTNRRTYVLYENMQLNTIYLEEKYMFPMNLTLPAPPKV